MAPLPNLALKMTPVTRATVCAALYGLFTAQTYAGPEVEHAVCPRYERESTDPPDLGRKNSEAL